MSDTSISWLVSTPWFGFSRSKPLPPDPCKRSCSTSRTCAVASIMQTPGYSSKEFICMCMCVCCMCVFCCMCGFCCMLVGCNQIWSVKRSAKLLYSTSMSMDCGCIPQGWKQAIVCPIFKKGSRKSPSNYNPVSLTSVCCKVMESIVNGTLSSF